MAAEQNGDARRRQADQLAAPTSAAAPSAAGVTRAGGPPLQDPRVVGKSVLRVGHDQIERRDGRPGPTHMHQSALLRGRRLHAESSAPPARSGDPS